MNTDTQLTRSLDTVLEQLSLLQKNSGEFQTQEYYPFDFPEERWFDGIPSPFITSSALLSLMEIDRPVSKAIEKKGTDFIRSRSEKQLWRFWDNKLGLNKVPLDTDDTALCSFLMQRINNEVFSNRDLFLANRNDGGLFLTWFFPAPQFLKYPSLFALLLKDRWDIRNTIAQNMLASTDFEVSVIANVLLYMGQNSETQKSIDFVSDIMLYNKPYEFHFYDESAFTWYHISRAYKYSVKDFEKLKPAFLRYFDDKLKSLNKEGDLPLYSILANTFYNFGYSDLGEDIKNLLLEPETLLKHSRPYPYFTSKNRRYRAGSSALTLSWYAEYLNNSIKHFA